MPEPIATIPVWPEGAPNHSSITEPETVDEDGALRNVTRARIEVFVPDQPNGKAVVAMPGGGYGKLNVPTMRDSFVPFLLEQGFTAFLLKYRLPAGNPAVPLADIQQALRIVRSRFAQYALHTVGVLGASAGGHLAAMASVAGADETRPDFSVLVYPNITMMQEQTQPKSACRNHLIGPERSVRYDAAYSAHKHVGPTTPPAFLAVSAQDEYAGSLGCMLYARAMIENGRPVTLHVYETGNHRWGIEKSEAFPDGDNFRADLALWLRKVP